jgi:hypothetical protein
VQIVHVDFATANHYSVCSINKVFYLYFIFNKKKWLIKFEDIYFYNITYFHSNFNKKKVFYLFFYIIIFTFNMPLQLIRVHSIIYMHDNASISSILFPHIFETHLKCPSPLSDYYFI